MFWNRAKKPVLSQPEFALTDLAEQKALLDQMQLYPPKPLTLPYINERLVYGLHKQLIYRIANLLGQPPEEFKQTTAKLILTMIRYFGLLPASERHHHSLPGGAVAHALDVGYRALARMQSFNYKPPKPYKNLALLRDELRLAVFLSGMWHDLGKPQTDLSIIVNDEQWIPINETLYSFLERKKAKHYSVIWNPARKHNEHVLHNSMIAGKWLAQIKTKLPTHIQTLILEGVQSDPKTLFGKAVFLSDSESTIEALATYAGDGSTSQLAANVKEALRNLISMGGMQINGQRSKVLYTEKGLHLLYPDIYAPLNQFMHHTLNMRPSLPNAETLLKVLVDEGWLISNAARDQYISGIDIEDVTYSGPSSLDVLTLSNPALLAATLPTAYKLKTSQYTGGIVGASSQYGDEKQLEVIKEPNPQSNDPQGMPVQSESHQNTKQPAQTKKKHAPKESPANTKSLTRHAQQSNPFSEESQAILLEQIEKKRKDPPSPTTAKNHKQTNPSKIQNSLEGLDVNEFTPASRKVLHFIATMGAVTNSTLTDCFFMTARGVVAIRTDPFWRQFSVNTLNTSFADASSLYAKLADNRGLIQTSPTTGTWDFGGHAVFRENISKWVLNQHPRISNNRPIVETAE